MYTKEVKCNVYLQKAREMFPNLDSLTVNEISKVFGIGTERVREIEQSAIRKLRHPKVGKRLLEYCRE